MASLARSEGLLALRFRYFRQVAQHAQRELIDHREQRGELVCERFQGFGPGRAARLNDSLLARGGRAVPEGPPGAALRLKKTLLHISRQGGPAPVGLAPHPMAPLS